MKWKDFKRMCMAMRKESQRLSRVWNWTGRQVWCTFTVDINDGIFRVMDINPYGVNLTTGAYMGRDLRSGEYISVNIKETIIDED